MLTVPLDMRAAPTPTPAPAAQMSFRFAYVFPCPATTMSANVLPSVPQRWELSASDISQISAVLPRRLVIWTVEAHVLYNIASPTCQRKYCPTSGSLLT